MTDGVSRRDLFKLAGVAGAGAMLPGSAAGQMQPETPADTAGAAAGGSPAGQDVLFFFNEEQARFISAAIDRLIPPDPEYPGAAGAGVLYYIDRQLSSAYGSGARMYLGGPWRSSAPAVFGYQLRQSPADLYRIGIEEARAYVRDAHGGSEFWDLDAATMDQVLSALETGEAGLPSVPSPVFFETLLANTIEGFFADPAYGGNRDMAGWRMIGFPGAYATYYDVVEHHGMAYTRGPISFADEDARQAHINMDGHG